jgi:hypothetical protein
MEIREGRLCMLKPAEQRIRASAISPPMMDSNWVANILSKMFEASEIIKDFPAPGTQLGIQTS